MNSNTHNQTSDKLPLSTHSLIIPTYLVIHQISTISNPSTTQDHQLKISNKNITLYIFTQNRLY